MQEHAYLFHEGTNYQIADFLGAHPLAQGGYRFVLWAPSAKAIAVVGDFNDWRVGAHPMQHDMELELWSIDIPEAETWQRYKYAILPGEGGTSEWGEALPADQAEYHPGWYLKSDPYARHYETPPATAAILYDPVDYVWQDEAWMLQRSGPKEPQALNIYELHLGSWRRYPDGSCYNYRDIAEQLADHCEQMGFNAVEFLPLTEYPFEGSWGYQVSGYFAPTSRYGTPADLKYLIDTLHQRGIRVFLDWVPAHFPRDAAGLARFDGRALFEHPDPRLGEHKEWGTLVFDYGRPEVRSFLMSSALFWLRDFHLDGLRVDAVSSMLYTHYGRSEYVLNRYGGVEYLEAIEFLKQLNQCIAQNFPKAFMMAEESTTYPKLTWPVSEGGLGFTHKWNMGWMHDTLDYSELDYYLRVTRHNKLSFGMTYIFDEHYILPYSHDEVVHGKRSLIDRMPGDLWRKFAAYRCLLMFQMAHPGAKLNFMGYEFAPFIEWRYYEELEWFMLQYPRHQQTLDFVKNLNHIYLNEPCFWRAERGWDGFQWLVVNDYTNEVFAFARFDGEGNLLLAIFNFLPVPCDNYRLPVPKEGLYRCLLCSDDHRYDGSGYLAPSTEGRFYEVEALQLKDAANGGHHLALDLPPLAALYLKWEGPKTSVPNEVA